MAFAPVHGGCQCGSVRYTLTAPPREVVHCHCSMCRKAHGALFATAGTYDLDAVTVDRSADALGDYESTPRNHRRFCRHCGCQLLMTVEAWPDRLFVVLATLDPGSVPGHDPAAEKHIFWESRACWYDVGDSLPKVEGYGP